VYLDDEGSVLIGTDQENNKGKEEGNSWCMFFGGDIADLYDENQLISCLHNLTTSELAQSVSDTTLPGVQLTSHLGAPALVEAGEATPESFYTFYGFCGWDPGQLEVSHMDE
jgi:putative AlgH/UPF0301 family transcriptional regulator